MHALQLGRADSELRQQVDELEKKLAESERKAQDSVKEASDCKTKMEINESNTKRLQDEWQAERQKGNTILSEMQSANEQRFTDAENNWKISIQQLQNRCQEAEVRLQQSIRENEIKCQTLRNEFQAKLSKSEVNCQNLNHTIGQLHHQRSVFEEEFHQEISRMAQRSQLERERNDDLERRICHLNEELDEAHKEITTCNYQMSELTVKFQSSLEELHIERQEAQQLREEKAINDKNMNKYSDLLAELRLCNARQQDVVKSLQTNVEELQEKSRVDSIAFDETQKSLTDQIADRDSKMEELQKAFQEVTSEKRAIEAHFEKEINFWKKCSVETQQQLNDDYEWKLREIEKDYKNRVDVEKKKYEERVTNFTEEHGKLTAEKDKLRSELTALQSEMSNKLANAEAELNQLRGLTNELQKGAKVASTQLDQMRNVEIRLREEHSETRFQLRETRKAVTKHQNEIAEMKLAQERELRIQEIRLASKLNEETRKLNSTWTDKLRLENEAFKEKIDCQYREEKMSAMAELKQQMDDEMENVICKHKLELNKLSMQIESLREEMKRNKENYETEANDVNERHIHELQALNRLLGEKEKDYQRKKADDQAKEQLVEDLQMQLSAHRGTVELVRADAENRKQFEIDKLKEKHQEEIDTVITKCEGKIAKHQEIQTHNHKAQLQTARIELEKFMELSGLKEQQQQQCIEELRGEISLRDGIINRLNNEVDRLKSSLSKLSQDMEFRESHHKSGKGKECTKIAKEPREEDMIAIRQLRQALINKDQLARKLQEEKKLLQLQLFQKVASMTRLSTSLPVVDKIETVVKVVIRNS